MDAERAKALGRCVTLIRIAEDTRCPDGEREAAKARAKAIAKRHHLTREEVKVERARQDLEAQPRLVRAHREREEAIKQEAVKRQRAREAAAAAGQGNWVTVPLTGSTNGPKMMAHSMRFGVEGGQITVEIL